MWKEKKKETQREVQMKRKAIAAVLAVGGGAQKGDIQMFYLGGAEKEERGSSSCEWRCTGGLGISRCFIWVVQRRTSEAVLAVSGDAREAWRYPAVLSG